MARIKIGRVVGDDGFSPVVYVSKEGQMVTIHVTDANGTTSATVRENLWEDAADIPTSTEDVSVEDALNAGKSATAAHGERLDAAEDAIDAHGGRLDAAEGSIVALNTGKAPVSHAAEHVAYGIGSATLYGHVMAGSGIPQRATQTGDAGLDNGRYARATHAHPESSGFSNLTGVNRITAISNDIHPEAATGTINCGSATNRWNTVYAANALNTGSDRRIKKDIKALDTETALALLMGLQPKQYKLRMGSSGRVHYGLIAQELVEALQGAGIEDAAVYTRSPIGEGMSDEQRQEAGITEEDLDPVKAPEDKVTYGLRYEELIAPLIAVVQQQQRQLEALSERVERLEAGA